MFKSQVHSRIRGNRGPGDSRDRVLEGCKHVTWRDGPKSWMPILQPDIVQQDPQALEGALTNEGERGIIRRLNDAVMGSKAFACNQVFINDLTASISLCMFLTLCTPACLCGLVRQVKSQVEGQSPMAKALFKHSNFRVVTRPYAIDPLEIREAKITVSNSEAGPMS